MKLVPDFPQRNLGLTELKCSPVLLSGKGFASVYILTECMIN
jgi:hypothetical protein